MNIAIVGCGKLGIKVLSTLIGGGHSITCFDTDRVVLDKISQTYDVLTVCDDGKSTKVLLENGIDNFDFLIAVTNEDEKNIVIASFAKKIGCKKTIARVRDPKHADQIKFIQDSMDIDYIVNPDYAISNEIYKYLVEKYTMNNGIFSNDNVAMIQFNVTRYDKLIGLNMIEISKLFEDMLIFAISRKGKLIVPHGHTVIEKDDTIFLVGEKEKTSLLYERVYDYKKKTQLEKVMILGGGKTGYYLAKRLKTQDVAVKIIEVDKERCYYLSTELDDVMILHGDATDVTLLDEENISDMDAVVSVTGFDEENLLLSLIAKNKGVEDVIAKVSRQSYKDLIEQMGVEIALNPLDIITSNIISFVQGSDKITSSILIQGQGEVMEIVANKNMKITNKYIKNLKLPEGMLLTAIDRDNNQVIIPNGNTKILDGDKVTIFYLLSELNEVDKLFITRKLLD